MAEQKAVQILFLRGISGAEEGLLHAVGVAVADEDTLVPDKQQPLALLRWTEVAVAGDLIKFDVGALVVEPFTVPPAVPQVEDHPGRLSLYRPQHIGNIPVRVGQDQNFHSGTPFRVPTVYAVFPRDAMAPRTDARGVVVFRPGLSGRGR